MAVKWRDRQTGRIKEVEEGERVRRTAWGEKN